MLLEQLADEAPVVLVIEDAHWADRSTRDLLAFLIRNQGALDGLLIVVTYRSDELHRTHPLRPLLAELDRISWVTRIELGRLSQADTGELAARLLGREPGADLLETVYRRTEGNPLFVEALLDGDGLGPGLPESLRDLLVAGVRRLPEETQEVVRVASAGGERIGHALLATVTGLDSAGLTRALRPAVAANVLLTDPDGFVFRHALIRESMQQELLPGEGGRLHCRFAEAIGSDPALVPPGRAAAEQAHHWYAAHDLARALASAWQAAAESGQALAYAEQLAMLSRVLELWDQVPGAAGQIGTSKLAVLETAMRVAELAGEFDRGITFAKAALDDADAVAEPIRAALLLEARGHLKYLLGRTDYAADLQEAARLVPADPPSPARARVLEALAHDIHHRPGGWDDAEFRANAEEAVAVAREAGDAATEAAALTTLACAMQPAQDMDRIRELLAQARALAAQARAYQPLLRADITESDLLEDMGQHEQAAAVARDGLRAASSYGLARTAGAVLAINLAEPLVSLGRWEEAAEVIERALQLFPPRLNRSSLWRLAGDMALARGDLATATDSVTSIRAALHGIRYKDEFQLPAARLETELRVAQKQPAAGLAVAEGTLDMFNVRPSPRYAWPLLIAGARACTAAAAQGQALAPRAGELADRLRTEAGKLAADGPAQQAHQLTFAAEIMPGQPAGRGDVRRLGRRRAGMAVGGPALPAGPGPAAGGRSGAECWRPRRRWQPSAPGRNADARPRGPAAERGHRPARPAGPHPAGRRGGQRPAARTAAARAHRP